MMRCTRSVAVVAAFLWIVPSWVVAEPAPEVTSRPSPLTIAVLDFDAGKGSDGIGAQVAELLTISLSGEPGFTMVDRAALQRVLEEQSLNLAGVVDTEQAVKVGRLVGARILVTGKIFSIDGKTFLTSKLIGTETSLVEGVLVQEEAAADISAMTLTLAQKIAQKLPESGPRLVAQDDALRDPLPGLKARLAGLRKPRVAVIIPERHMTSTVRTPDPAVETEVKLLLRECGFVVQDVKQNALADFARTTTAVDPNAWPRELAGVDYVIVGEGFSEFSARIGGLVSCAARAEINVIRRTTGHIDLADRTTERGVDLSENTAAKSALQKAGRTLGLRALEYFANTLPKSDEGDAR